jgi:signal peptidase I
MDKKNELLEWLKAILIAIVAAFIIRTFLIDNIEINQISMNPTFYEGDRVIISKISYHFSTPKMGDIIVFTPPNQKQPYIKRVIGIGGDTVAIEDGKLYVNGKIIEEPYIKEEMMQDFEETHEPEGTVFVMGDNRNYSKDSRSPSVGFIPVENIWGKVKLRYWPLSKIQWFD